jgi:hypothetical protein
MLTRHFAFYSISIFYIKSVPQLIEFRLTIDVFFSLFYSYILSSHSEIFLLSLIVSHIYPMNGRAFLDSVICHRIEKSANVHFQYQILNLLKLSSDSFWSKYILPLVTQHSLLLYCKCGWHWTDCVMPLYGTKGSLPVYYSRSRRSVHASIVNDSECMPSVFIKQFLEFLESTTRLKVTDSLHGLSWLQIPI